MLPDKPSTTWEKNNRDKFKLNKTQYIAMRSVLDAEIARCPEETEVLRLILDMLVDHPSNIKKMKLERCWKRQT